MLSENNAYTNGAELAQQIGILPEGSFGDRAVTSAFNAKTAAGKGAAQALRELA